VVGEVHVTLLILDILVISVLECVCPSIGVEQTAIPALHSGSGMSKTFSS